MANVLHKHGLRHFQFPQAIISQNLLQELTRNELALYLHILSEVQRTSRVTITATLDELVQRTGISVSKVGIARSGLIFHGLVVTNKISGRQEYTLTDPNTGVVLNDGQSRSEYLDFDELDEAQLRAYFITTLTDAITTVNGLAAHCPFHADSKPSLSVSLANGGAWKCHGCKRKGKLIHFEMERAKMTAGEAIDSREAYRRILDALRTAGALDSAMGQPEATYTYCDDMGEVEFEVLRYLGKRLYAECQLRSELDYVGQPVEIDGLLWKTRVADGLERSALQVPARKAAHHQSVLR